MRLRRQFCFRVDLGNKTMSSLISLDAPNIACYIRNALYTGLG
jgi:hypothetical protein